MKAPIFVRADGGKFEISANVLQRMLDFVQDEPKRAEAGGVLLGRHIVESTDVVVDEITLPMAGDRRSRRRFFRGKAGHQEVVDRLWQESNGTCVYLGGWHSHPEADPTPSDVDFEDWKRRLREDVFDSDDLYFVIVGTEILRAWIADKKTGPCTFLGACRHGGSYDVADEDTR